MCPLIVVWPANERWCRRCLRVVAWPFLCRRCCCCCCCCGCWQYAHSWLSSTVHAQVQLHGGRASTAVDDATSHLVLRCGAASGATAASGQLAEAAPVDPAALLEAVG